MASSPSASEPVALLYQATPPPEVDGIRKPMKPGGYSDSGADIAWTLRSAGVPVVTPQPAPDPSRSLDWVFPDTHEGIAQAFGQGARVLWANTVLFSGHPLQSVAGQGVRVVGQHPALVDRYDDKWLTNEQLRARGCPVPASALLARTAGPNTLALDGLSEAGLAARGLRFPLVVKPIRGRGSEGVCKVASLTELRHHADTLLSARDVGGHARYGDRLMLERFLSGTELTLTMMPPGTYLLDGAERTFAQHWPLPAMRRFNHQDGIAPYNGVVAVVRNSVRVSEAERREPALQRLEAWCSVAAGEVQARAPIRIDCRSTEDGEFFLFDLNMKPNLTGAGRPGRDEQDSLSTLAAAGVGWSYAQLLLNMLHQAWRLE